MLLNLAIVTKPTNKAIAAQLKSLEFLAKVVLNNRIALDYLLAEQDINLCHKQIPESTPLVL